MSHESDEMQVETITPVVEVATKKSDVADLIEDAFSRDDSPIEVALTDTLTLRFRFVSDDSEMTRIKAQVTAMAKGLMKKPGAYGVPEDLRPTALETAGRIALVHILALDKEELSVPVVCKIAKRRGLVFNTIVECINREGTQRRDEVLSLAFESAGKG